MPNGNTTSAAVRGQERPVEARFAAINRERMHRIYQCLNPRQQDFLELLPLLFHTNHPLLPGYVTQTTPAGIRDYAPGRDALAAALRQTRSFRYKGREQRRRDILGLYLMGSTGTIAYSPKSDFDIWLCHPPELGAEAAAELKEKSARIEAHAAGLGLDVHFFVFDPDGFRNGELISLSAESSGSSQHYLLLDEFYRSAVVIAGLYPAWWQVPPEEEADYDRYIAEFRRKRFAGQKDLVDFGGVAGIPAEEFFGAAIWHLYKSIDSPYKSVLKLLLIEAYADEYPRIDLLATRYKKAVYEGVTDTIALDPYLQMYRKVEEYLMARQDKARLELLRRAFYFKVNEKLSRPGAAAGWRREVLELMTRQWGWEPPQIALLDIQEDWKLPVVLEERRDLIAALTQSYRALSQFARRQAGNSRITQQDLHILGRKLYAAFERKAGKVDVVNHGIVPNLNERRVSLHQLRGGEDQASWALFCDAVTADEVGNHTPLKRTGGIVEMLAWCHFNGVIGEQTLVHLYPAGTSFTVRELRLTLGALQAVFPNARIEPATAGDLTRQPRLRAAALFVNAESNLAATRSRSGDLVASSRSDALSFGALHENLADSVDLVLATSWEEVLAYRYQGPRGLFDCLCEILRLLPGATAAAPPIEVFCFSRAYGVPISERLRTLVQDVGARLGPRTNRPAARLVIEAQDVYYALERCGEAPAHRELGAYQNLIDYLGEPLPRFTVTAFDGNTLTGRVLPAIYEHNREGCIQVFFQQEARRADMFVLDERGSLYTQSVSFHQPQSLMNHLYRFFSTMLQRVSLLGEGHGAANVRMDFRMIARDEHGGYRTEPALFDPDQSAGYKQVKVIVEATEDGHEDGQNRYSVLCEEREFTTLEHGTYVFTAAARHIIEMRRSGLTYPIYITDVDLSQAALPGSQPSDWQTVRFLRYKKMIEERFADALRRL